jgi:hypothetical protein
MTDSPRKNAADSVKEKITAANAETVSPLISAEFDFGNGSVFLRHKGHID